MTLAFPIPPEQRVIRNYTGRAEQPIRTVIVTAADEARAEVDLDAIARLLGGGLAVGGLRAVLALDTMLGRLEVDLVPLFEDLILRASMAGELIFAAGMGLLPVDLGLFRQGASVAAREIVGNLIVDVSAGQVEAVRAIIAEGFELGRTVEASAKLLREVVGLDPRRAGALSKYEAELEAEGRAADQIERMVAAAGRRKLKSRALSIARTETIRAASESQDLIWEEGVRAGQIDQNVWEQEWVPIPGACRRVCLPLKAARAPIGGTFPGRGGKGPPAHPFCRCGRRLRRRGQR